MPDRIVRAGILTSDPVNTLSWPAEVLYRRLHSIVDDYGRYDGRSSLLRAHLYPLKIDKVSEADVGKWLTECVTAGLVSLYRVAGRPYVEVTKFGARVRAETSKWPSPDEADKSILAPAPVPVVSTDDGVSPSLADIRARPHADAAVFVGVVGVVVDKPPHPPAGGGFAEFWRAWPKSMRKVAEKQCAAKWKSQECDSLVSEIVAHVVAMTATEAWKKEGGNFIPAPLVYLNQRRWEAGAPDAPSLTVAASETIEQYSARRQREREAEEAERLHLRSPQAKAARDAALARTNQKAAA